MNIKKLNQEINESYISTLHEKELFVTWKGKEILIDDPAEIKKFKAGKKAEGTDDDGKEYTVDPKNIDNISEMNEANVRLSNPSDTVWSLFNWTDVMPVPGINHGSVMHLSSVMQSSASKKLQSDFMKKAREFAKTVNQAEKLLNAAFDIAKKA
jgi:hypothetical protein